MSKEYPCVGGPRDGVRVTLEDGTTKITFPIMPEMRVRGMDEPIEMELDPWGCPRVKRPPYGNVVYVVQGDHLVPLDSGGAA